jgi:hypothetical protein
MGFTRIRACVRPSQVQGPIPFNLTAKGFYCLDFSFVFLAPGITSLSLFLKSEKISALL